MSDRPSSWSAFRDLDASPELEAALRWLSRAAQLPPLRAGKKRSYELLGIVPGDRILDVGCGTGVDVLGLAPLISPGGEVVGVDSSAGVVAAARRLAALEDANARFEVADAVSLPFPDDSFDACRCDRTLQHIDDPQAAVREMVRVTRPRGTVLVSEGRNTVVTDGAGAPVLHELLTLHQTRDERAGWLGFMVPLLLRQAGLDEVRVENVAGTLHSAEEIATFYDLRRLIDRAAQEEKLPRPQRAELTSALTAQAAGGRLSVTVETLLFVGHVPS